MHTLIFTCIYIYIYHVYTYTYIYIHLSINAYTCSWRHWCVCLSTHVHKRTCTYVPTLTHVYVHMYTYAGCISRTHGGVHLFHADQFTDRHEPCVALFSNEYGFWMSSGMYIYVYICAMRMAFDVQVVCMHTWKHIYVLCYTQMSMVYEVLVLCIRIYIYICARIRLLCMKNMAHEVLVVCIQICIYMCACIQWVCMDVYRYTYIHVRMYIDICTCM